MTRDGLREWLAGYERAWRSPGTAMLADLFSPDAAYRAGPFEDLHRGLEAIANLWESERTGPDEAFTMKGEIVAVEGTTGVARVEVEYGEPRPRIYRDLWIVRFDGEDRCSEFEEWPFWPEGQEGTIAGTRQFV